MNNERAELIRKLLEYADSPTEMIIEELAREAAALLAADAQGGEAVTAQQRFRRPEKGMPDWGKWTECAVNKDRRAHEIDSQGWEVEYRLLYTHPQPQSVPHGWKPVPVEPTQEMLFKGRDVFGCNVEDTDADYRRIYRAMLAASPAAPQAVPPTI